MATKYLHTMSDDEIRKLLKANIADASVDGSGLYSQTQKIKINKNNYTMLIGIGGTGVTALNRVKQYLENRVEDYRGNIALLAIDSDADALDNAVYLENDEKFQISISNQLANENINVVANRTECIRQWINPDFYVQFDTKGANQIRQAGRAKLFIGDTTTNATDKRLRTHIHHAASALKTDRINTMQVFILAGLSGGTGSGTFLDVAMLVKDSFPTSAISGFFFLPDTVEQHMADGRYENVRANAYAALKEIDYYVGIQQWDDEYFEGHHTSDNGGALTKFNRANPLFKMVTLISGSPTSYVSPDPARAAMDTAVESLINMLAANNCVGDDGSKGMMIDSFLSNAAAARTAAISAAFDTDGYERAGCFVDDNFAYNGIGIATASIPEQICTSYVVRSIISKMYADSGNIANQYRLVVGKSSIRENEAAPKILQLFGQTSGNQISYADVQAQAKTSTIFQTPQELEVAKDDIISNSDSIRANYNTAYYENKAKEAVETKIKSKFQNFKANAINFIKEYGPQALIDLYDGKDEQGIFTHVKSIKTQLIEALTNINFVDEINAIQKRLEKMRDHKFFGIHTVNSKDYVNEFTKLISAECYKNVWEYAFKQTNRDCAIKYLLIDKVDEFIDECRDLAKILNEMNSIYGNLASDFDTIQSFAGAQDSSVNVNVIGDDTSYRWAKGRLDQVIANIDVKDLISNIIDEYFTEGDEKWHLVATGSKMTLNARESFDRLMGSAIRKANDGNGVMITINDYILHRVNDVNQSLESTIRDIANNLINHSEPLFRKIPSITKLSTPKYYIVIPNAIFNGTNGNVIVDEFRNSLSDADVYLSDVADKIVCYYFESGNPLYSLSDLPVWEAAYNKSELKMIHMNESGKGDFDPKTGLAWKNYPPCRCNFDARQIHVAADKIVKTPEYQFLTGEFDPMFDKALEYGIVRRCEAPEGGYYYEFINIDRAGWNYSLDNYTAIKNGRYEGGATFVDYIVNQNRDNTVGSLVKRIELKAAPMLNAPCAKFTGTAAENEPLKRAKRALRRNVKMYVEMKRSVLKYEEIYPTNESNEVFAADVFINAFVAGLIVKNEAIFNITVGKTPEVLLNSNPIAKRIWKPEQKYLFDNGFVYLAAFNKFFELYNDYDKLEEINNRCNKLIEDTLAGDPTGIVLQKRIDTINAELAAHIDEIARPDFKEKVMDSTGIVNPELYDKLNIEIFYSAIEKYNS